MKYLHIKWHKAAGSDPLHLYSELDGERYERRKVEIFGDGRRGFADASEEAGGTFLGTLPVPTLDELAGDDAYEAKAISQDDFQRIWLKRR
ncbi:MAG: hypothetical protein WDM91_12980 [Rhizomicrobium sp.]